MEVGGFTAQQLYPRGKNPDTHWIGGWVSRNAGLDAVAKISILPFRESNPGFPARCLVTIKIDDTD
jgi:hypothetical protein